MNVYYDVEDNHYRTYPDGDIATVDQIRELIENKNLSIVKLQQENKILRDNAEYNDKVVDKVNWENMLLKKENKQLKIQINTKEEKYRELEDKYKELDKMCELYSKSLYNAELNQYKNNWNKLKEYIKTIYKGCPPYEKEVLMFLTDKMHELEQGSDSNE